MDILQRIRTAVERALAEQGLAVNGELRGVVLEAGRPETGIGFRVELGAGLPAGWHATDTRRTELTTERG